MSSDNIFTRNKAVDHSVKPANLLKDRSSPYKTPYKKKKEEPKKKYNSLLEIEPVDNSEEVSRVELFDHIIGFLLGLIGKRRQWEEARLKLKTLQNRITAFENVIKESTKDNYSSVKLKDYNV